MVDGKPIRLTVDHRPDHPDERQRIEAAGGTVVVKKGREGAAADEVHSTRELT